ncbi:hypothetical protein [Cycloclasticus sp.]|uniref:hypothetical protein n=1 Tax=Cycloclasticus sp. TaxID=2024830 RepID=UPI00257EFCD5|nr:hypothetical protein [Cycloclasticus sp.]
MSKFPIVALIVKQENFVLIRTRFCSNCSIDSRTVDSVHDEHSHVHQSSTDKKSNQQLNP